LAHRSDAASASARGVGDAARIVIAAILFRLFSAFAAFLANLTIPQYQDQGFSVFRTDNLFWDAFARYDAGWYHGIASRGYVFGAGGRNNLAFFPVYPMLMRAGGWMLGGKQQDFYFVGIVVSWLAFAAAMVMLYRLARLDLERPPAFRSVMYAAAFPFAYFFGMVYSESVFLLALVSTVYALRTRRWALAALTGAVMTATRVTGVMAIPGLAWVAWQTAGRDPSQRWRAVAAIAGCLFGIGGYCVFNYALSGTLFAWYDAITFWGYRPGGNPFGAAAGLVQALLTRPYQFLTTERMAPYDALNALAAIGAIGLTPLIWWRFNGGYALIVLAGLLLPLSSGQFEGLGRYCSVQFPIALVLASFGGEMRHHLLLTTSAILYAICMALFVTVHPLF
jgi:hypothetical protein